MTDRLLAPHASAPVSETDEHLSPGPGAVRMGGGLHELLWGGWADGVDDEMVYATGYSLYTRGMDAPAMTVFGLLVARNPFEPRYIKAFAASLKKLGRAEGALQQYLCAASLDTEDPAPILHACECLISLGRLAEAREGLEMIQSSAPGSPHDRIAMKARGLRHLIAQELRSPRKGRSNDNHHPLDQPDLDPGSHR